MLHLFLLMNIIIHTYSKLKLNKYLGVKVMENIKRLVSSKGKIVVMPILIVFVLIAIFIFNGFQSSDNTIMTTKEGTFIQASGMVEHNSVTVSSEIVGTIDDLVAKEGEKVKEGQVIAYINNTSISNQYKQALISVELAQKNIKSIEDNLASYDSVNASSIEQAKSAYMAAEGEYERVLEGASSEEVQQAEEALNQAKVNLDFIEANLNKSKILLESEAISHAGFDEVELNHSIAVAQFNTASSKLQSIKSGPSNASIKAAQNKANQAKAGHELAIANGDSQLIQLQNRLEVAKVQLEQSKAQAELLKAELDKAAIKSPIDGIINFLTVSKGEFTQLGKPIVEIYDPSNIEIKVYVSEANIGHVKVDQDVNIFVDSDDVTYTGKVIRINSNAEFTPKNIQTKEERVNTVFEVKIKVADSQGVIKSGMPVDVNIKID